MKKNKKSPSKKLVWKIVFILLIIAGSVAIFKFLGPNTGSFSKDSYLYIPTGTDYEQVLHTLDTGGYVNDVKTFNFLAQRTEYPAHIKPGRYHLTKGMSSVNILRMLKNGNQEPVKLVINKLRTKQDLVNFLSGHLEADSVVLKRMFNDNVYLAQFGLDSNTVLCAVIPDTYEFYWNTSADKVYQKLFYYYAKFWTEERKNAAETKELTIPQVVTIASIVEEETNNNPEKGNIASVYLNRYKRGMKLQADPTTKFAIGDFTLRRITGAHTSFPSPYNTYYASGLPPGPICTPSKTSVEAVLEAPQTDYLYFCAKEDFSGTHRFSSNYAQHYRNAKRYQQALNERKIQ